MYADRDLYRKVVGRFATGIAIVTTVDEGMDHAMTVNSFSSVSLDPLLALFCAEKIARFHDSVLRSGVWGVSVLAAEAEETSRFFAHRGRPLAGRLAGHPHHRGMLGVPLLDEAIATLECRTTATHSAGDHTIIVGSVETVGTPQDGEPLLYHEGRYRRL
ncbi:flavin reductase family protein [Acrocarpospora catenulata]|uniref:flavin reductase family protein n=1 Tax=Acrocarpospora catenulata TaxID=2836182 RepID=UPI001BD9741B|nr:flavin reductase family protein [Acrocarpospora catenulata]